MLGLMAIEINNGRKPCIAQLVGDPRKSIAAFSRGLGTKFLSIAAAYLVRRAISKADGAIFVSQALRTAYLKDAGQRSLVANESRIDDAQRIGLSDLAELHRALDGACPSLVYVGRLSPEKGIAILLQALALVPDVKLTIIGDGVQRCELEGMTRLLGIEDRVYFFGSCPWDADLLKLIRHHHALILPSFTEGLPLVLIEAMSQGVPVIASSVGGVAELITDGVSGLLFSASDVNGLAAAITRLISDSKLRFDLAESGLHLSELHTAQVQYGKSARFILEVMGGRGRT
jgi:glycosyltransferase involved in cell wall biosynthesis